MIDPNDERHQLWMHGYYAGRIDERKSQEPTSKRRRLGAAIKAVRRGRDVLTTLTRSTTRRVHSQ